MKLATAFIEVRADDKRLDADLDGVERKVESSARSTASSWARAFGGVALTAGIKRSVDAASRLEQAIGGTAAVFGEARREVDQFAESSARNLGISNSAARELTSQIGQLLQGLGYTGEEAARTSVQLATLGADLAAAFGGRPEEAVQALGAALRGEYDPLERYVGGINAAAVAQQAVRMNLAESTSAVDGHAKAQATLALIMERSANVQGQAAREANTAAGQQARAAAMAEDAAASFGENLLPVYTRVVQVAGQAAAAFGALPGPVQTGVVALAGVALIGPRVADGLSLIRSGITRTATASSNLVGRLGGLKGALGALGWAGAIAGAIQLARSTDHATVDVERLAAATANLTAEQEKQLQQALLVASGWGQLDDIISQTADSNVLAAERLVQQAEAAGVAADEISRLRQIIDDKRDADAQGRRDQEAYAAEVDEAAGAARRLTGEIDGQTSALERNQKALEEVSDALYGSFDANIAYRRSLDSTEDALGKVAELQQAGKTGTEEYERALLGAEDALLDQAEAAARAAEQQAKANGETWNAKDRNRAYVEELVRLRDTLAPGSPLRAALDGYILQIGNIPKTATTKVEADLSEAERQLREFMAQSRTVRIQAQIDNPNVRVGGMQVGRQLGGPVNAGDRVRVGEAGPEEVVFGQPGTVIPNHELRRQGGSGGVQVAGDLHIHVDGGNPGDVFDETLWRLVS